MERVINLSKIFSFLRLFRDRRIKCNILVVVVYSVIVVLILLSQHQRDVGKVYSYTAADVSYPLIKFPPNITSSLVIATVDERFISVGIPWATLIEWDVNPTAEKKITILTKALSPAYARIGGTAADFVNFNDLEKKPKPFQRRTIFEINRKHLDRINQIAEKASWQVLFTLSSLKRSKNGSWDPSNPLRIVKYAADRGYKFGWELGNEEPKYQAKALIVETDTINSGGSCSEPNYYRNKQFDVNISSEQLAEDFKTLRTHLSSIPGVENFLVGPDVTQPGGRSTHFLRGFLEKGQSSIDAVTWHHYDMKAEKSSLSQFFAPEVLDALHRSLDRADEVLDEVAPNLPRWLGETANVAGGGAKGMSDRFVSGFLWLNKLGVAAQRGYKVIIRQSMFRGHYSLLGKDLEPNPDYWLSVIHKRLFGTKVLGIDRGNDYSEMVRVFAHCTKTGLYKKGAVSLMAMNLHSNISVDLQLEQNFRKFGVHEYLFSPDGDITSRKMRLNEKVLEMGADSSFPVFQPNPVPPGVPLILPPLTYAFYVVPEAKALACLETQVFSSNTFLFSIPHGYF